MGVAVLRTVEVTARSSSGATIRLNGGAAYQLPASHVLELARLFQTLVFEEYPSPDDPYVLVTLEPPS